MAIFMILVHRINFKLHILIILNNVDKWAVITPMQDHSKITKMSFWTIKRAKNWVFDHFREFVQLDRLDIVYIMKGIYAFNTFMHYWIKNDHLKTKKNAFMNDEYEILAIFFS